MRRLLVSLGLAINYLLSVISGGRGGIDMRICAVYGVSSPTRGVYAFTWKANF